MPSKMSINPAAARPLDKDAQRRIFQRGVDFLQRKKLPDAYNCFEQVLRANPKNIAALNNIGNVCIQMGIAESAEKFLRNSLNIEADNIDAILLLATAYIDMEQADNAIEVLERAFELNRENADIHAKLAHAYREEGRGDEAVEHLEKSLQLAPGDLHRLCDLGQLHIDLGHTDSAVKCFEQVLDIDASNVTALSGLSAARNASKDGRLISLVRERQAQPGLENTERALLLHAEGKILNDQGRYDDAMNCFIEAKRIAGGTFNLDRTIAFYNRQKEMFSSEFFADRGQIGFQSDRPVFVLGMPRSGTTLTEQICASHPDVYGAGELRHMRAITRRLGLKPSTYSQYFHNIANLKPGKAKELGKEYVDLASRYAGNESRIVDKMPHNFEKVGLIATLLPNARIIHCERNPLDNCVSIFMNNLNDAHNYSRDLHTLGLYYREYSALMAHWKAVSPVEILTIRYEDMVADFEEHARKIIDFLDLEWNDACLEFYQTERVVRTLSRWQVRQPVYSTSVGRWKRYEARLGPLIDALGDLADT